MAKRRTTQGKKPGARSGPARGKGKPASFGGWALDWLKSIAVALLLFLVIRTFLVQTFTITSGSMENTLLVGDWLMISKLAYGPQIPFTHARLPGYSHPERGDVAVFKPPPPDETDLDVVKRIIGMPGDTLSMRRAVLYIDGKPQVEPYVIHTNAEGNGSHPWMVWQKQYLVAGVNPATYHPTRDDWGPIVVPPHHYFMMGDNRDDSLDSRFWGFLPEANFEGRAFFIYFSYDSQALDPFPFIQDIRWHRVGKVIR